MNVALVEFFGGPADGQCVPSPIGTPRVLLVPVNIDRAKVLEALANGDLPPRNACYRRGEVRDNTCECGNCPPVRQYHFEKTIQA